MLQNSKPGTALYYSVKEEILELIKSGTYKVGSQLPTEAELCKLFDVSRTTIRLALQQLELEGRIYKVQGKGTFVSKPKIQENLTQSIKSFSEQMKDAGLSSYSKVLSMDVIPATSLLAHSLEIEENDPVIKLVRLRFAGTEPYQHATSYIPWKIAPGLLHDDCSGSLFQLLTTTYKVNLLKSVETLEPVLPDIEICELLHILENTPSFLSDSLTYSTENVPIEFSTTIARGDIAKFVSERFYKSL